MVLDANIMSRPTEWPQYRRGYHCLTCKFEPLCEARIVGGAEVEESVRKEKFVEKED